MCTEYSLNKEGPSQGVILIRMKKKNCYINNIIDESNFAMEKG